MRVHFSPLARADLLELRKYIALQNPLAAARLMRAIYSRIYDTIASFPEAGQACNELAPGLRRFPIGNYVVFYRFTNRIEIARILHGAREVEAFFRNFPRSTD